MAIQRVSRNHKCSVCGKPDWCSEIHFPNGNIVYCCPRKTGTVGDLLIGYDGREYRLQAEKSGNYLWETKEQFEENRAAFIKSLPPRNGGYRTKPAYKGNAPRVIAPSVVKEEKPVEGVAKILPPSELDRFYRKFLSLLILERKHEEKLLDEWGDVVGLLGNIKRTYPVKSIPPEDHIRFSSTEKLYNKSRKGIMEELIKECGEPKGVPGFYQRKDGSWTFFRLCGIAFPMFNTKGEIIRLRVMDDYPECDGEFDGAPGVFQYARDDEQGTGWFFVPMDDLGTLLYNEKILVHEHHGYNNAVKLNDKGFPEGSFPDGKYKNFSSYQEIIITEGGEKKRVNRYRNGCQSGSACSLYTKPGDDRSVVYATEGEKKALVANMLLNVPTISIPGVNGFGKMFQNEEGYDQSLLDALRESGTELAVLVYDADKNENEHVLKSEEKAVQKFIESGMKIALGEWNSHWGKGLDDILLKNVRPQITMVG